MPFFLIIHLFLFVYLFARLVFPMQASRKLKAAAALVLLLISQHFAIRMFFGQLSSPEMPALGIIIEGWSFAALIFLCLLVMANDILALGRYLVNWRRKKNEFLPDRRKAMLAAIAVLPAAYGVRQGVGQPETVNTEAKLARLQPELDGLSIVHLTDLHVSPLFHDRWVSQLVKTVNSLEPDLVLFTGDLVDGLPDRRTGFMAPFKNLRARYGIFGCTGNHEYYSDFPAWMEEFPALGLNMLLNGHKVLHINGQPLVVAGVTDKAAASFGLPVQNCSAALRGAPDNAVRILLAHRPEDAAHNASCGADLQLSGHTHGGQLIGMNRLVARANAGYVHGWYQAGDMSMYVNAGAGLWNGFPIRLGVPAEITRIVLRCA